MDATTISELGEQIACGYSYEEFVQIFKLKEADLDKHIITFGEGPSNFNFQMTCNKKSVISIDPIYKWNKHELLQKIISIREILREETINKSNKSTELNTRTIIDLEERCINAMNDFLLDYEDGKIQNRYMYHQFPDTTDFKTHQFSLGLCYNVILLNESKGLGYLLNSIKEMLRISKELRIFPILNDKCIRPEMLYNIVRHLKKDFTVEIVSINVKFHVPKQTNEMMIIKSK